MNTLDIYSDDVNEFLTKPEGTYFDRKSERQEPNKIADLLIAFANAEGGVAAIGITNREFTGINSLTSKKINDFTQVGYDFCEPTLKVNFIFRDVININGEKDRILLLEVYPSEDKLYKNKRDEVFLRIGDETKRLTYEQRKELEYEKNIRRFESETISECTLGDLDMELVSQYKAKVGYSNDDLWKLFFSRGLAKRAKNEEYELTVAGVLCFAEFPGAFIPNAKIRFIRYDGTEGKTGTRMNVIKEETIEGPLSVMLEKARVVVGSQLRDFTILDEETGKFTKVPEYPVDAWQEGIVNAVTHRAYNLTGDDIRVIMYDDRIEIHSPGKFPSLVTPENIKDIHYSRNPYIARTLSDFGWVREFGEGVNRMYEEMSMLFLDEPIFEEKHNQVVLTLKNNIMMRSIRQREEIQSKIQMDWKKLNRYQKRTLSILYKKKKIRTSELSKYLSVSLNVARNTLESLRELNVLSKVASSQTDPNQYYTFKE